ncbi:MAG: hypothetical protein K6U89_08405 [Chloroflexi bacterium]|nr:hypothetical protein [Chloroflexota bacterium]
MPGIEFHPSQNGTISLDSLVLGTPGITSHVGAYYAEAATVCLEEADHHSGVQLRIDGDCDHVLRLLWNSSGNTEQRDRSWHDDQEATENGAYGIAVLLITELADYTVVERAQKGPGFDFWLGKKDSADTFFQDKARLEVSGIRRGDDRIIAARVRRKMEQISRSDREAPGVVVVVEFGSPRARVKTK